MRSQRMECATGQTSGTHAQAHTKIAPRSGWPAGRQELPACTLLGAGCARKRLLGSHIGSNWAQKTPKDFWYWSYKEDTYLKLDKFSSTCKCNLYLYPLLRPDIYDLFPIHENGYQEQSNMDVPPHGIHIDKSDDYIRSEDCQDEYKLSCNEYPLWHAIDVSSCNGASMSQAFAAHESSPPLRVPP